MCESVIGRVVPDVSKARFSLIFMVKQSGSVGEGTTILRNVEKCPSEDAVLHITKLEYSRKNLISKHIGV